MGLGSNGSRVNGVALNNVGISLNNIMSESNAITSAANNIDASLVSDFSSGAVGGVESINTGVSTLMEDLSNLETSYGLARDELNAVIEEERRLVAEELQTWESTHAQTVTISSEKTAELDSKLAFYFNYPSAAKEAKPVSESQLRSALEKNGATKTGDNTYKITMGGKTYTYNVKSGTISVAGSSGSIYAKFYATSDANLSNITNTITIMGGSGSVDTSWGTKDLTTGVKADSSSLIILPYGEGIMNKTECVAGATRVGNFMTGGKNKSMSNSIIGYSLGGHIATRAITQNPGLYDAVVYVNSGAFTSDLSVNQIDRSGGNYNAFKDMQIIFFEGSGDKFTNSAAKTIDVLTGKGVPKSNFYIYTNDKTLIKNFTGYLGKDHVIQVPDGYASAPKAGWRGHSYGINMIKNSNIVNYLSRI